ncbi:hypothetical protein H257_12663 [Aphanomyces astaci]|uniref:Uncharacterized protein n=1 Tax=Aphanomyces astaci TaxID=112090 RepID=W4FXG4_APHAT|nr:hypothetical protein H257_12663 [Aphanomyces astaci]ETV72187.1 hypothetical protein H257_12663 [Aphanomyces astaci]|eukprot:XP_009838255.1 hypothetical protein H257_12663 [Aphanomyces astaci]
MRSTQVGESDTREGYYLDKGSLYTVGKGNKPNLQLSSGIALLKAEFLLNSIALRLVEAFRLDSGFSLLRSQAVRQRSQLQPESTCTTTKQLFDWSSPATSRL